MCPRGYGATTTTLWGYLWGHAEEGDRGGLALDSAALDAKIAEGEKSLDDAEYICKSDVEGVQVKYGSFQKEKDTTIANVKKTGLGMLKAVKAHASAVSRGFFACTPM